MEFSEILFKAYGWAFSFHRIFARTRLPLAQRAGLQRLPLGPSQGSQISSKCQKCCVRTQYRLEHGPGKGLSGAVTLQGSKPQPGPIGKFLMREDTGPHGDQVTVMRGEHSRTEARLTQAELQLDARPCPATRGHHPGEPPPFPLGDTKCGHSPFDIYEAPGRCRGPYTKQ